MKTAGPACAFHPAHGTGSVTLVSHWSLTWSLSVSLGVETRAPCSVFPVSGLGLSSEAHRVVLRGFDDIVFNPVFNIPPASALLSRRQHYVPSIWYLFFHPTTGGGGSVSPITILRKKDKTDLTRVDRGAGAEPSVESLRLWFGARGGLTCPSLARQYLS